MKSIYFIFLFFISVTAIKCQNNKPDTAKMTIIVKQQATKMSQFLTQRKFDSLINMHHPRIIQGIGGSEKVIEAVKKTWQERDSLGIKLLSDSIGEPSKIIYNRKTYQCVIPQTMTFLYNEKERGIVESPLIAISNDGEKWYFIDAVGDVNNIRRKFPELSDSLIIPKPKSQVIVNIN